MNRFFPLYRIILALLIILIYRNLSDNRKDSTLKYQFILTHLVAALFIMLGLRQFAFLTEFNIVKTLNESGIGAVLKHTSPYERSNLMDWLFMATVLGFHVSIIISSMIVLKRKTSLFNSLIAISIAFVMFLCLHFYNFEAVLDFRNSVGNVFSGSMLTYKYVVPGIVFTSLGFLIFFNPWTNKVRTQQQLQLS